MRKMQGEEFDSLVSFFDDMARTKWLGEIHDELKHASGSWENKSVLDVGCGTGRLLLRGVEEASLLTGVDLSTEMLKASKQNFFFRNRVEKTHFSVEDACDLSFENNVFDLSLSTCVMFLLPEPEEGMKEMIRVTKTAGKVVMLNPSLRMDQSAAFSYAKKHGMSGFEQTSLLRWSNVSTKRHRYTSEELSEKLKTLGAKEVNHIEVLEGLAIITVAQL
ncbi:class I SAM-dependent methyltransferase [Guptibacillus algicola]|uniref:class I SAM-dependent methyltransferase n=1 Tax=Guptibacillus algicola TaxID=225844 RepID=UPI001CD645D4|nr:class I SAM-dependent methyltransferase [Alkalihalobacillus algicola]MCA0988012.1 methyltransferase domain-containing protein [Alkalihalobacillus algicola]